MASTIPEKLYVTIQYRKDSSQGLLGFSSPYTKDAPFEKRKATQDSWAYGYGAKFTIDDQDDSISGEFSENSKIDAMMLFSAGCYPKIVDNSLTEGFEIAKSVRRSGWGGGGNVVWRIADPRGYELEISSENFARIIDCTTIINGVIQGKCCWGRDGAKNILLPEASDVYQDAKAKTFMVNNKVAIADVTPGDTVRLLNKNYEDKDLVYLGKYQIVTCGTDYAFPIKLTIAKDKYLFKLGDEIVLISNPTVGIVASKASTPIDPAEFAEEFRNNQSYISSPNSTVLLITPDKVTHSQLSLELINYDFKYNPSESFPRYEYERATAYGTTYKSFYSIPLIAEYNNKQYITHSQDNHSGIFKNTLREVSCLLGSGVIKLNKTVGHYGREYDITIDVPQDPLEYKQIAIKFNGKVYPLNTIGYY